MPFARKRELAEKGLANCYSRVLNPAEKGFGRLDLLERAPRSAIPKAPTHPSKKNVVKLRVTEGLRKWFLTSSLWEGDHAFHNTQ